MKSIFTILLLFLLLSGTMTAQTVVNSRTAVLIPGGYSISGNAILEELSTGKLQLRLDEDFATPAGPDVRIHLSNVQQSISNAIEIADIGTEGGGINHFSGAITFDVPDGITIDQYDFVVFYCVDFNLHWAHGNFGEAQAGGTVPDPTFECQESLTATTDWVSEVTVCTNDGIEDIIPLKNNINEPVGANYAYIITDDNGAIEQVILNDTINLEGTGIGIQKVYGVSYDGNLIYNQGDLYTTIASGSCAIVSSSEIFLTITKEHCSANISGTVTNPNGTPLSEFELYLDDYDKTSTYDDGSFIFNNLSTGNSYTIIPQKNNAISEGVSTRDLVFMRRHILGIEPFTSGFQNIAADVTNNGSVSTGDMVQLQRFILGITDNFPNNQSWRFVNATDLMDGQLDPTSFNESFYVEQLTSDITDVDFIGVKIGDVSNVATSGLLDPETQGQIPLQFIFQDTELKVGTEITIPISANNFKNIEAFQFTIDLEGLELDNISSNILDSNKLQFAQLDEHTITTLWSSETAVDLGNTIFELHLRATEDILLSEGLSFNSKVTPAIAYTANAERLDIELHGQAVTAINEISGFELFQNTPNPFSNETTIPFQLTASGSVTLNIYDITGKIVHTQQATYDKGAHVITLNGIHDLPEGVLYYQLATSEYSSTKKMIRL